MACAITVVLGNDSVVDLNANGCPTNPAIKKQLPHETYCNKFYLCTNGELEEMYCAGNLVYNEYTEECDWLWNVNCKGKNISESKPPQEEVAVTESNEDGDDTTCNSDPSKAPEICAQPENDGALVANERCNFFFKCSHGNAVALRCPRTTAYDACKNRCDWLENVDCGNRTLSDDSDVSDETVGSEEDVEPDDNDGHVDPEAVCAQEESDGVLVPHDNCNQFYICSDGRPIAQVCPSGTAFNPRKQECDWLRNVNCGNKTMLEPEDNVTTEEGTTEENVINGPVNDDPAKASEICAQNGSEGVLIANEMCDRFYTCVHGRPTALRCSDGLLYNPRIQRCDWPENVNCGNRTIPDPENDIDTTTVSNDDKEDESIGPVNANPAEAPTVCAQEGSDGVLVANENCNKFYICVANVPVDMKCGKDLHFNTEIGRCDFPKNVNCGNRTIPKDDDIESDDTEKSVNDNPSEAPEICARDGSNGVLIAHENCNQYYKCNAGVPNALSCSNNLMYDVQKGWCDRRENVDCGNRVKPESNSNNDNPSEASAICAQAQSEGVLVAHENCNQYYKCSHGVPVALECMQGLLFNAILELCDWPMNVDCGQRLQ